MNSVGVSLINKNFKSNLAFGNLDESEEFILHMFLKTTIYKSYSFADKCTMFLKKRRYAELMAELHHAPSPPTPPTSENSGSDHEHDSDVETHENQKIRKPNDDVTMLAEVSFKSKPLYILNQGEKIFRQSNRILQT